MKNRRRADPQSQVGPKAHVKLPTHCANLAERVVTARPTHWRIMRTWCQKSSLASAAVVLRKTHSTLVWIVFFGRGLGRDSFRLCRTAWNKLKFRGRPVDGVTAERFVLIAYDFSRPHDDIRQRMLKMKLLRLRLPGALPQEFPPGLPRDSGGERRSDRRTASGPRPPTGQCPGP